MRVETKVIPVEGISKVPGIPHDFDDGATRQRRDEFLLLNVVTGISVALVCLAWIAIALD
jgi:hypothetical protein